MNKKFVNKTLGYNALMRMVRELPKERLNYWLRIIEACLSVTKTPSGEFAGAWVLEEAKKKGITWFPNLRSLVSYGILKRTDVTRGGRRAYYIIPDSEGVAKALEEIRKQSQF